MKIDCISDTHGFCPKLEGGDLLIVAGDLTKSNRPSQYDDFLFWMHEQNYKKKILIAGNHDNVFETCEESFFDLIKELEIDYLFDSATEFEGLEVWGSPWTKTFPGMNPHCKAFTCDTEEELAEKWALIPHGTDILITHSPPYGILDKTIDGESVGSKSLALKIGNMNNPPKLWVCGHIHEAYGQDKAIRQKPCIMINASHVNEYYKPVNKPIRIEL